MVKRHLLRISMPRTWAIKRKTLNWVLRPNAGPHKLGSCMPMGLILKEVLGYAKTSREAKKILEDKSILVNKKVIRDLKAQVGFMDVLEIPKLKEQYRMIFDTRGKLKLKPVKASETDVKICKILSKRTIKGKKTQLGLSDGSTMLAEKDNFHIGDSIVLSLPDRKIKATLKLEKGATVYMMGGKKVGTTGKIESIAASTSTQRGRITMKIGSETFETIKDYAFVVGEDKPTVELQ